MNRLMDWLLSRPPIDQVKGLREWIQDPHAATPVEIGRAFGLKLAAFLAAMGCILPVAFESGRTPFDRPVASTIGALLGVAAWLAMRFRLARGVRLSADGLEVATDRSRVQMPWSSFAPGRRALLVNGLVLSLPLRAEAKLAVTGGAIVRNSELILFLLQRVRADDLCAAVNAGMATFGSAEPRAA
jgi:hypothetical protein